MANHQQHFDASRKWQEFYQKAVEDLGVNIPGPTLGQTTNSYRREMMRLLKKTFIPPTHDLYQVQMRGLPDDVLAGFEQILLPAVKVEAFNPATVPKGEIREVHKIHPQSGHKMNVFIGQESFVKQMGRPGRRVIGFKTDQGYMNTSGRFLR
jgi:hypothetical protein